MNPPIFTLVTAHAPAVALLGSSPTRFWPFDNAPHSQQGAIAAAPYCTWQTVYGTPENTLGCRPETDMLGCQIDCYATTVTQARQVAAAVRDAIEGEGYVVAWNGEWTDAPTGLQRVSFTWEAFVDR